MSDASFLKQLDGYGPTTAQIHCRMPDQPALLQLYLWQEYDLAPNFPTLQSSSRFDSAHSSERRHNLYIAVKIFPVHCCVFDRIAVEVVVEMDPHTLSTDLADTGSNRPILHGCNRGDTTEARRGNEYPDGVCHLAKTAAFCQHLDFYRYHRSAERQR